MISHSSEARGIKKKASPAPFWSSKASWSAPLIAVIAVLLFLKNLNPIATLSFGAAGALVGLTCSIATICRRQRLWFIHAGVGLLLSTGLGTLILVGLVSPPDPEAEAKQFAAELNAAAPVRADADTRIDGATAGPGKQVSMNVTLLNATSDEVDIDPSAFRRHACSEPKMQWAVKGDVLVTTRYFGKDGKLIGVVPVQMGACPQTAR